MVFTREDAARAAQNIGIDFKKEAFQLEDLLNGMNTELARHGTKAGTADVTHDDPTMTAKLAVANLRVSPSYYSQRVGKSAWISIHALREEGDSKNRDKISIFKQIIQHSARI